ncbi:MAG: Tol-Pal system beta propeller repeat protein TolB [Desulfobacterales bacterium]|jgi:TolB protein
MIGIRTVRILSLITAFCCLAGAATAADVKFIEINPFLRKVPLAIPDFQPQAPGEATASMTVDALEVMEESLLFTGYFSLVDRGAFLENPKETGIDPKSITYRNWSVIGTELLITGGLSVSGETVEMEFRLYDTVAGKYATGKRYRGNIKDYRRMVRKFCGEVVFFLTGSYGFFNSEIAFVSTGSGNKEIYVSEFDGRNPKQFTRTGNITLSPAWSPDGNWLAYTAYGSDRPYIYIKHRKLKQGYAVKNKGLNITPAWLPTASTSSSLEDMRLAATLSFSGDQEIYLLTGKGKIIKRLTKSWGSDVSPTWSPDGKKMAFVSSRSGNPQVYIKDVSSGAVSRLTFEGRYNTQPSWSPSGDKIAYTAMDNGLNNIVIIDVDGDGLLQLTQNTGNNESPSWSPDGSLIAFSSTREGPSRIYVMTSFGTDQRRLLALPGEQSNPKWSPNFAAF